MTRVATMGRLLEKWVDFHFPKAVPSRKFLVAPVERALVAAYKAGVEDGEKHKNDPKRGIRAGFKSLDNE